MKSEKLQNLADQLAAVEARKANGWRERAKELRRRIKIEAGKRST